MGSSEARLAGAVPLRYDADASEGEKPMREAKPGAESSTANHLLLPMVAGILFVAMLVFGAMVG